MKREYHFEIENYSEFVKDLNSKPFVEISGENIFYEKGFETKPIVQYIDIENFPNCCKSHKGIAKDINIWFEKFPYCCETHKKLQERNWFKKELFNHIPEKILIQFEYTTNFINKKIETKNWYSEITDYIEYNFESFGEPGIGEDRYNIILLDYLENNTTKKNRENYLKIISFLKSRRVPSESKTDLNKLYSIFQKWVKSLPNLPFFKEYKFKIENRLPIKDLLHSPQYNRYSGSTKFKCRTPEELIELLIKTTKKLLLSINTSELYKDQHITVLEKQKIDIVNEKHQLTQKKLLLNYTNSEIKYVKIIKSWLSNEKKYFKEITELFDSNEYLKNNNIKETENTNLVFLSYCWESEEHKSKTLSFCVFLRENGFNCEIDRSLSQKETSINFNSMMINSINHAKKVIIILSNGYKTKAENKQGGVSIEYEIILKDIDINKTKYILVSFSKFSNSIIPEGFINREIIDLSDSENFNILFSKLKDEPIVDIGNISTKQPKIKKICIEKFE